MEMDLIATRGPSIEYYLVIGITGSDINTKIFTLKIPFSYS